MKAKVYINRIKIDYQTDFAKAKDYFKRHGVDIDFEFTTSDLQNFPAEKFLLNVGYRWVLPMKTAELVSINPTDDFTIYVFNQEEFSVQSMPNGRRYDFNGHDIIHIGTHTLNPKDLTYVEICHEIMHALTAKANKAGFNIPDQMDTYYNNFFLEMENSNFGIQWKLLKPYLDSLKSSGWKYFTPNEVKGLKPHFVDMMDKGRGESNIAWAITSGLRTPEHNRIVGGSPTSAHLDGTGVDIRARNWVEVGKIVDGARKAGIIGITVYKNSPHVHLDLKSFRLEVK